LTTDEVSIKPEMSGSGVGQEAPFGCTECQQTFGSEDELKIHNFSSHLWKPTYHCGVCQKQFSSYADVSNHKASDHRNRKLLDCQRCNQKFVSSSRLLTHLILDHQTAQPFECKLCQKIVLTRCQCDETFYVGNLSMYVLS